MQLAVEQRRDLAGDAEHREQVDAVDRRRHVEHLVADRKHVDERRARLGPVREHHDPRVVVAEADLVLGEDHPARRRAAELALVERLVEDRQIRAGESHRDGRACLEVPRAADDLPSVALPHVDLADAQPVGVGMRIDLEHAADQETTEIAVDVGYSDVEDPLDLRRGREEPFGDLARRRVHRDVLAQPRHRDVHRELLQEARIVAPELAQIGDPVPEHRDPLEPPAECEARVPLGVVADELEEVRIDHARAADLDPARSAGRPGSPIRRRCGTRRAPRPTAP